MIFVNQRHQFKLSSVIILNFNNNRNDLETTALTFR